ncbi:MAG TPA: carbohydrate-binding domain-containing protein [Amaricoccus sp.]|uniref:carbohydrate-binding domain-containing protein n=1 Tax=Amaricoccus sp. TaxID=1872485 RepID=UPI002CFFED27|nr:carbohydrate-binding domain-containing protein [Amaricoccus sp.]HMQ92170.1 carbohydrate-binding domain-containing protein [Amaricoccus sp.]HMR36560.1 carbohydrate-binding domain-containing protein [Paracoccus sp. (in: a-proteobacteria)]HMR53448.1 carbohydrate-binding domain-containing protein [Amaricoccus sp.]HMU00425.1 carbohydrate-binding domain-containing protein [Amaricoccus sp.]
MSNNPSYERGFGGFTFAAWQTEKINYLLADAETIQGGLTTASTPEYQAFLAGNGHQAGEAVRGLAAPIYETLLEFLSNPDGTKIDSVKQEVWSWLAGASDVNNKNSYFGRFIHAYTEAQYALRGGTGDAEFLGQKASNNIGINLARDILASMLPPEEGAEFGASTMPGIIGIGSNDAVAAAQDVFSNLPDAVTADRGSYAPWAGTLLMPYLQGAGYDDDTKRLFEDWLIPFDGDDPDAHGQIIGSVNGENGIVFKTIPGSYDLISTIVASRDATELSPTAAVVALRIAFGVGFPTQFDHEDLILKTTNYSNSYYDISSDFDLSVGDALIFNSFTSFLYSVGYQLGTLQNDSALEISHGRGILHAGWGNDNVVLGAEKIGLTNFAKHKILDGGDGSDKLDFSSLVYGDRTDTGLFVTFEEVDGAFEWRAAVTFETEPPFEPWPFAPNTNLSYGFERYTLSDFDDAVYIAIDPDMLTSNTGGGFDNVLDTIDGGGEAENGDLLDFSFLPTSGALDINLGGGGGAISGPGWTLNVTDFERLVGSSYGDTIRAGGDFTEINGGFGNDVIFSNGATAHIAGGMLPEDVAALADEFDLEEAALLALPDNDIFVDDETVMSRFVFSENGGHDVVFTDDDAVTEIFFEDLLLSDLFVTVEGADTYDDGLDLSISTFGFEVISTGASLVLPWFTNFGYYNDPNWDPDFVQRFNQTSSVSFRFSDDSVLGAGDMLQNAGQEIFIAAQYADPEDFGPLYSDLRVPGREFASTLGTSFFAALGSDAAAGGMPALPEPDPAIPPFVAASGTSGQDLLGGTRARDRISAGSGDDLILGGEGDDEIDGGGGFDAAIYEGSIEDYDVVETVNAQGRVIGFTSVTDTNVADGDEGADELVSVERLKFSDGAMQIDPSTKFHTVTVRAGGSGTLASAPMFEVTADGVSLGVRSIAAPVAGSGFDVSDDSLFQDYAFQFSGDLPSTFEIVYFNDGTAEGVNRNLAIDFIDVDGVLFESESDGLFMPASGAPDLGGVELLTVNGRLVMDNLNYLSDTFRMEAEDFVAKQGSMWQSHGAASGNRLLRSSGTDPARANAFFEGEDGVYDIDVGYFDENDGAAQLSLFVNGRQIDSFVWDQDLGSANAGNATRAVHTINDVEMRTGDLLELRGSGDGGEPMRTDYFDFAMTARLHPSQVQFRVEAEDMTYDQGVVWQQHGAASGDRVLKASGSGEARASHDFGGDDGVYGVSIGYFDENDGAGQLALYVDGVLVDSFTWNQDLGSDSAGPTTRAVHAVDGVEIRAGDLIELRGYGEGGEPIRTDYIDFTYIDELVA